MPSGTPREQRRNAGTRLDVTHASTAGVYDAAGGGKDNYAPDRSAARRLASVFGAREMADVVTQNRAMQRRAVAYLAEHGFQQFIDIGPAHFEPPYLHEVARRIHPMALFAYVDNDPVVVAHGRAMMKAAGTGSWQGDVLELDQILDGPVFNDFLNPAEPVAVVLGAILHFVTDDQAAAKVLATLRDRLAAGSAVLITHATPDDVPAEKIAAALEAYQMVAPIRLRSCTEVEALLKGWKFHDPGIAKTPEWMPDEAAEAARPHAPHLLAVVADLSGGAP